jgi:hypothetical protein
MRMAICTSTGCISNIVFEKRVVEMRGRVPLSAKVLESDCME